MRRDLVRLHESSRLQLRPDEGGRCDFGHLRHHDLGDGVLVK